MLEILLGVVIVALVSVASWISISVLTHTGETSRNRSLAINLAQKSQEEVRRAAQSFYNDLDGCVFPPASGGMCTFDNTMTDLPEFTRTLTVSPVNGSTELKQSTVRISWLEFGQSRFIESTVYLSRPADPIPGNILGKVTPENKPGQPLSGVTVTVSLQNSTESRSTLSVGSLSSKGANFDFAEAGTGRFVLSVGKWQLTATHPNYFPYTHSELIDVTSNQEEFVPFEMEPKPESAKISGTVVDAFNGNQPVATFNSGRINLLRNGSGIANVSNSRTFSFTVNFNDTDDQCFTLNTEHAFKSAYAFQPGCGLLYDRHGWSSARVQEDNSVVCGNPRNGNSASDRICVSPGDEETVNLPVVPVPEVLITGRVVDNTGKVLPGAVVRARWPRSGDSADWRKGNAVMSAAAAADGRFSFSVPAVQGMFANANPFQDYLQVWASASVQVMTCCNTTAMENRSSITQNVGPLFPGDGPRDIGDLVIPANDRNCGNATGKMMEKFSGGSAIPGVSVRILGSELTDGAGVYLYSCPAQGFKIPQGGYEFLADKSGYYSYRSGGNMWYASRAGVSILANQVAIYDGRLWPIGAGTVTGTVKDAGSGNPLDGADVELRLYTGARSTAKTDSSGRFRFDNVLETWPPPSLPANDPYYQHAARTHSVHVTHPSGIYLPKDQGIPQLNAGETVDMTILLTTQGNM